MKNDVKSKEQIKTWVFYEYTYIVTVPIPSAVEQNCSLDALLPLQKIISIHCWCLSDECSNVLDRLVLCCPWNLKILKVSTGGKNCYITHNKTLLPPGQRPLVLPLRP